METINVYNLIMLIFTFVGGFIVGCGFYKNVNSGSSKKVKQKKHNVCVLIYNQEHLEKAKKLLDKYNEKRSHMCMYPNKTYIYFYETKWYTYPFKSGQTSVTLGELEEILKNQ